MRGLKSLEYDVGGTDEPSHPTRVRGLKLCQRVNLRKLWVAPYTGAWIEIEFNKGISEMNSVAPYTGAWIEIIHTK